jgi:phosphoribosylanthranilate isomerase
VAKIKICGLSRREDIAYANICMPDYIGFVFAPSRRQVSFAEAAALRKELHKGIRSVGVFVNEDIGSIAALCREGVIDAIQLHGDEDGAYVEELRLCTRKTIIKAVSVRDELIVPPIPADYFLFDSARAGIGQLFDWGLLEGYQKPYFLAGGLGEHNIARAVKESTPYCVDISSGVETDGRKDLERMQRIIHLVRRGI